MSPIGHTERGLTDYADFVDTYGARIRVRESSAASEPRVWIFVDQKSDPKPPTGAAHLNVEQAEVLIMALQEWIADASR